MGDLPVGWAGPFLDPPVPMMASCLPILPTDASIAGLRVHEGDDEEILT